MYTAIVLDKESRERLVRRFIHLIPSGWDVIAHHMTINMGPITKGPADPGLLGQEASLTVESFGADNKVMAVGVSSEIPSANKIKHITLAVNRFGGGKPVDSNNLKVWQPIIDPFVLHGVVKEVR